MGKISMRMTVLGLVAALSLVVAACASDEPGTGAPTGAPGTAQETPGTAAQPTPANGVLGAQATPGAPAQVTFPEAGRNATIIVPFAAGGGSDVVVRTIVPELERELGIPITVVNRPGAGAQVGITELTQSTPDGYTIANTNVPSALTTYLDPARQAVYGREDIQPIANMATGVSAVTVAADSRFQTLEDLLDEARANPEQVTAGTGGLMGTQHVATVMLEQAADVSFGLVHFDGGAPALTALLGGHIDFTMGHVNEILPQVRAGAVRVLGVADRNASEFLPEVPTLEEQGYEVVVGTSYGLSAPAATPSEIVDIWEQAIERAVASEAFRSRVAELGLTLQYMDSSEFEAYWLDYEDQLQPLISAEQK
jgi:tripartite-type tricarboxylate transporter receptor subunit TctC